MKNVKRAAVAASVGVLLFGCGGGGEEAGAPPFASDGAGTPPFLTGGEIVTGAPGDGAPPVPDPTILVSSAAIQAEVFDGSTGGALAGATLAFGAVTGTTDASGFFTHADYAATSRLVQKASSGGFEDLYLPTTVATGVPSVTQFKLTPRGSATSLVGTVGGSVTPADGVGGATFPANALEDSQGAVSTTPAAVRFTSINAGADSYRLSGDYRSSTGEQLEVFGAAVLENADGLQIASTVGATLRIPVGSRSATTPGAAGLYYLDPASATWVHAGTANLVATDPAAPYYEGSVTRFGQWIVGSPLASPVAVRGCVQDDTGATVANVRIVAEGISYTGLTYAYTDVNGQFVASVKPNSQLLLAGRRGAVLSNAVSVATQSADLNLGTCLTLPSSNAATVRLTWGSSPRDVDSHLLLPGGAHVYFVNKGSLSSEPFASLDVDDVSSFGPEITTIRRPKVGVYRFFLHNFSGTFNPGMTGSPTRVELNYLGRTAVFSPPAGEANNEYWHLFDIQVGADCSMTLYRYNRFRPDEPAHPAPGAAAPFCVPG